jgi:NAD(P)-dependent dehydrogenase (short-subunit alcohol dehydrogenase family)
MIASIAMALVGVAVMAAPGLLDYDKPAATVHHVAGPIIATFGAVSAADAVRPVRRAMLPFGLLVAVVPLVLGHPLAAEAVSIAAGVATAALSLVPVSTAARFGGGWTALIDASRLRPTQRPEPTGGTAMTDNESRTPRGVDVRAALDQPASRRRRIRLGDVERLHPGGDGAASRLVGDAAENGRPSRGRVVVVTGASAGVGRAIAHAFGAKGDSVALIARDGLALDETAREVESAGGRALVLPLDVSDADAVEAAAARVEAELGPIDIWVNNAMVSVFSPVHETTADEYRRVTEVTYLGYVHGTLSALRRMRPRDRGTIIQIGSALAYRSIPLQSAYCAAKHAINGFSESLRTELIHDRSAIDVVQVQLPAVNTPQFDWVRSRLKGRAQPVPPIFQPEVIADAVTWVADHPRRELIIGASSAVAVLADKLAPGIADRYLAQGGYESQQAAEPEDPDRPDNLYEPVRGLHRTRGRFDDRSRDASPHLWLTRNVGKAGVVGVAAALGGIAALTLGRNR